MTQATDKTHDDKVFELGQAYVRTVHELRNIVKTLGATSHEVYEKLREVETIQRKLKQTQAQDRKRAKNAESKRQSINNRSNY